MLFTPSLRRDETELEARHASWLELFFDLVFVVAISQVAQNLSKNFQLTSLPEFILLFIPVWWCWIGSTFYATRFDNDGIFDRLIILAQMAIAAIMAVNIHHGLDSAYVGFTLSYVAFRGLLVGQYLHAGYYLEEARPLTNWYAGGFGISIIIWLISIFVPVPWRWLLLGVGLIIDFMTPLTAGRMIQSIPPSISHISERIGLFTLIVLGESVVAVVKGISEEEWTVSTVIMALSGLCIAFSFWWMYFDTIDSSPLQCMKFGKTKLALSWLYLHLPLVMGLTATGVSIEHLIIHDLELSTPQENWLFCLAISSSLISLAALHWVSSNLGKTKCKRVLVSYRFAGAIIVLLIGLIANVIPATLLVIFLMLICISQVILDIVNLQK